jgi:hypothetical protein
MIAGPSPESPYTLHYQGIHFVPVRLEERMESADQKDGLVTL